MYPAAKQIGLIVSPAECIGLNVSPADCIPGPREVARALQRAREDLSASKGHLLRCSAVQCSAVQFLYLRLGAAFPSSESIAYIDSTTTNASSV
jgi:hypothetical protein